MIPIPQYPSLFHNSHVYGKQIEAVIQNGLLLFKQYILCGYLSLVLGESDKC